MHQASLKGLTGVAIGVLAMAAGRNAWALDKYLDLEPAQTLSGYGYGYDSISRTFVLRQCVQFGTGRTDDGSGGASGSSASFSAITSNDQLADEMGISATTKFSASMGVASIHASSKVDFFQTTKTNLTTETILASYTNVDAFKYIAGDINLKPQYVAMVGTPQFRQTCGDYLIIGEQTGRWLYGTVQLVAKDNVTESKLAAAGAVDATYGTYSASVGVNTLNAMKQASSSNDLQIHVLSSGSSTMSTTIDEFIRQVQTFPGASGPKLTYMLKAVPYESIVANWPPSNPLAPLTAEQKLDVIAGAAAGFMALADDSDFIVHNPTLFALGTTPAKRNARLAFIRARHGWYDAQLETMRASAKNCDVDWDGTPACEALYQKWTGFLDFAVAEYAQFPVRYVSDCYAPRTPGDLSRSLTSWLQSSARGGSFSSVRGDREMGGGPVKFTAFLDFRPDFSGGDPLATRGLLADLQVTVEEDKADHSTFNWRQKTDVFDLSKPDLSSGGAPATLTQCAFHDTGVKATPVTLDPNTCNALAPLGQATVNACKQSVLAHKHHGYLTGMTGKNPRTETFNTGPHGVLQSMTCTVDSGSGNDTSAIGCSSVQLYSVQLDLINKADIAADAWNAGLQAAAGATTPQGIKVNAAHVATLKTLHAPKTRLVRPQGVRACPGGLTNVAGHCVPPLKR